MVTALLIVVVLVLIVALVGMVSAAVNGSLPAQLWFMFGCGGSMLELIGTFIAAIAQGIFEG